jgi:hypothetical protein
VTTVLFSANDPGGANAIASVVACLRARGDTTYGLLTGPAKSLFSERGIPFVDAGSMDDDTLGQQLATMAPKVVLAGTSVGRTIDKKILVKLGGHVPSVYVLDFWSNYWQRFSEGHKDLRYLPHKICVIDNAAKEAMISEGFPPDSLAVTGNPHFEEFAAGITRDREDPDEILFISQPISTTPVQAELTRVGYDEIEVLQRIKGVLDRIADSKLRLKIRLHPLDKVEKYQRYLGDRVSIASEKRLTDSLSRAGLVIGMSSPVLIQAATAGKLAISYQPGRVGADHLRSNALGITLGADDDADLESLFLSYGRRTLSRPAIDLRSVWPAGSVRRVVAVLDDLLS